MSEFSVNIFCAIINLSKLVINALDPIEELYDLYSDEKETPRITKIVDGRSEMGDGPTDLYMDL